MNNDSKILVAGSNGLVGSAIVRNLRSKNFTNVIEATRAKVNFTSQVETEVYMHEVKPDYVFVAAAKVGGIMANKTYPADFIYQNLMIQSNIIDTAYRSGCRKLVFLGSSCIYPKHSVIPITEDQLMTGSLEPTNDAYALAKISGIKMCQAYRQQYGFNAISLQPTNLYGIKDNFDPENSHVIPGLMRRMYEAKLNGDRDFYCWGDGSPLREFLYVDDPWGNPSDNYIFSGQQAYDIAATSQYAFEECFFDILNPILDEYDEELPLVMTGGCALNVLVNQKYKDTYDREVYVCPCPNDSGLSLGHMLLYQKPKKRVDVTYSGLPLLDRDELDQYIQCYDAKKVTKAESAKLLKDGNIIGFVYGNSEVGPRALGNRSIVCDPNIREMKDILNAKVKFREWYRPFAPFCKKEDASKYFESKDFENMEYMSYAPRVKEEYVKTLPSITHADNTARLQTVTEDSHEHFYDLLTEFGKISETNVLLNTSFNIRGYPILSTIEDALYALNNTQMDYVVIEDYLFGKAK